MIMLKNKHNSLLSKDTVKSTLKNFLIQVFKLKCCCLSYKFLSLRIIIHEALFKNSEILKEKMFQKKSKKSFLFNSTLL